jgi:hypothetical protein
MMHCDRQNLSGRTIARQRGQQTPTEPFCLRPIQSDGAGLMMALQMKHRPIGVTRHARNQRIKRRGQIAFPLANDKVPLSNRA